MQLFVWILFVISITGGLITILTDKIPIVISVVLICFGFFSIFINSLVYFGKYKKGKHIIVDYKDTDNQIFENLKVSFLNSNLFNQKSKLRHSTKIIYDFSTVDLLNIGEGTFVLLEKNQYLTRMQNLLSFIWQNPKQTCITLRF